jgi:hypothetical protein
MTASVKVFFRLFFLFILSHHVGVSSAFAFCTPAAGVNRPRTEPQPLRMAGVNPGKNSVWSAEKVDKNSLPSEFKTASGEIIDPYAVLNVSRNAERQEIRQSYLALSRRYHPDGVMHKDILPGSCNNLDEVREQWERIKLAYEILTDKRLRKRYDRHEMMARPGAAMGRAAAGAAAKGISNLGKGIFLAGTFAIQQLTKEAESALKENE